MKLQITAEGMELTDSIKTMVDEKLGDHLDKYLAHFEEDLKIADVVVKHSHKLGFEASFNMSLGHEHIYAKSQAKDKAEDLETIAVRLREEIEPQLKKYLNKLNKDKK